MKCLPDDQGDIKNIHAHLNYLRSMLKPGYEIICQTVGYKHFFRIIKTLQGEYPFE